MTTLTRTSPCKVNLLLNILGKRPDGFHELETVFQPVPLHDELHFTRAARGVQLSCDHPELAMDANNIVCRAAIAFQEAARVAEGIKIHLEKRLPLAAGLGGGSGNAAATLLGLNELFGRPLTPQQVAALAAVLGSDVPFFLQAQPALATGRGEKIAPLGPLPALRGVFMVLVYPGFGISTAWSYQQLAKFPAALNGRPGRARELVALLHSGDLAAASPAFYNSLEAPAFHKYPLLALYQEFLRANGALAALMSGSGSTTFALVQDQAAAEQLLEKFKTQFGHSAWTAIVELP